MALDRRNYRQLVDTTVELANKIGAEEIVTRVVEDLKDESEPFRKMVMETIEKVLSNLGAADIPQSLEDRLIDGILCVSPIPRADSLPPSISLSVSISLLLSITVPIAYGCYIVSTDVPMLLTCQIRVPRANNRRRGHAQWVWDRGKFARGPREGLHPTDLWYSAMAIEQQIGKGTATGGRFDFADRRGDDEV
jgi:hypothetical protein